MKLVSYLADGQDRLAAYIDGYLYDMELLHPDLPHNMSMFLNYWDDSLPMAIGGEIMVKEEKISTTRAIRYEEADILAPVPFPASCRDAYAFREHVAAARRNRSVPMIPEFDEYPVFYFTNHHSIQGPGDIVCMADHFEKLDFELEVAIVINRHGRNIRAEDADDYIAGFMIMNDMSARRLQMEEMMLNLGPAKGKDFCTVTGPWLVTPDELEEFVTSAPDGHTGKNWNLRMQCRVNGQPVSDGNMGAMEWTFAEIIERASYGVNLYAGDVIGSGTVGTGCFLELNGTGKLNNPNYEEQWLREGDVIEMEIEGLGILQNTILRDPDDFSILSRKKQAALR